MKAWDAVNEPMSDAVPTELKTAGRDGSAKENFYWQDHLGKDYARTVIRLARKAAGDSVQAEGSLSMTTILRLPTTITPSVRVLSI